MAPWKYRKRWGASWLDSPHPPGWEWGATHRVAWIPKQPWGEAHHDGCKCCSCPTCQLFCDCGKALVFTHTCLSTAAPRNAHTGPKSKPMTLIEVWRRRFQKLIRVLRLRGSSASKSSSWRGGGYAHLSSRRIHRPQRARQARGGFFSSSQLSEPNEPKGWGAPSAAQTAARG